MLLRAARDSRLKRSAVSKTLILLLRCLAVFCLIGAFSKPVADLRLPGFLSGLAAGAGRPVSLVILADRSFSMNAAFSGRTRRDYAAGAGTRILAALNTNDEAALVFFDSEAEGATWTRDLAGLSGRLAGVREGFRTTNYRTALEKAYSLLADRPSARKKIILLLSDSARNGFAAMPGGPRSLPAYDPAVALAGLSFPSTPNVWAGGMEITEENGRGRIEVRAGGSGGLSPSGLSAGLYAPAFTGSVKTAQVRPDQASAVFNLPAGNDPSGRAEINSPDQLQRDNSIFFSVSRKVPAESRILVLYPDPDSLKPGGGAYFLKKFFETDSESGAGFGADFMEFSAFVKVPGRDYGALIIFDGSVPESQTALIDEFIKGGGGAFIIAGLSKSPGAARNALAALGFGGGADLERDLYPAVPDSSGVFKGADFSGFDLRNVKISGLAGFGNIPRGFAAAWNFNDPSGAARPALYSGRRGRGNVLVWASSFSLPYTDLGAKPLFAPFMSACLRHLYGVRPLKRRETLVGRVYEGSLENTDNVKVAVTAPDGSRSYVLARDGVFKYNLTDVPGIYAWSALPENGNFAVNMDGGSGESSLEPEPSPPWTLISAAAPVENFKNLVYGVETGQFLLIIALLCFLAEFMLSRREI